ncbi:MAG: Gfo/Idh/MocA family oxidoreductase [Methanoregula sp.]|nr:Gfo/Idh/MocA family oxidoreductase [Methanoregula sp.]
MIKIAQMGIGYWGPNLLRNLVANKNCVVKTVADFSKERCDYVNRLYPSIKTTNNSEDIINDDDIDAIVIATPVNTHFDLVMKGLESGKHVLVEKPMATSVSEVEQIESLANKQKLVAMVGHTFLYNNAVRYIKKLIDNGDVGEIRYIYSHRLNLGRIRTDVDALWNFAPHDISIIQYWLDNPRPISITKRGMAYVQEGIDDVVFLNIIYPNKVMAEIHVSWLDPQKIRCITIVGTKKMIVYDDVAENKVAIYDKGIDRMAILGTNMDYDKNGGFKFNQRSGDIIIPQIDFKEPLETEIAHFLDCIINNTECLTGTKHAKEVVRILCREI